MVSSQPRDLEVIRCQNGGQKTPLPTGYTVGTFEIGFDDIESPPAVINGPGSATFGHNFGYSDNSQSNTMALLRKVGTIYIHA
jgi:hypothetical protein